MPRPLGYWLENDITRTKGTCNDTFLEHYTHITRPRGLHFSRGFGF